MVFKVFLDANVLLDFLLKRANYQNAKEVLNHIINGKAKAFITPAIVHIVGYWLTKAYGAAKQKNYY
jgi:predicted nucleic acid-binding protein